MAVCYTIQLFVYLKKKKKLYSCGIALLFLRGVGLETISRTESVATGSDIFILSAGML